MECHLETPDWHFSQVCVYDPRYLLILLTSQWWLALRLRSRYSCGTHHTTEKRSPRRKPGQTKKNTVDYHLPVVRLLRESVFHL